MLKRIFFHIGMPKTGTSVIQSYMSQNRSSLMAKGYLYPVTISARRGVYQNSEAHHLLTYSWAGTSTLVGWKNFALFSPDKFFSRAEQFCKQRQLHTMVLSAENTYWLPYLMNVKDFVSRDEYWDKKSKYVSNIFDYLRHFDTKIVIYLRRQDHWIQSWYNQQVKNGFPLPSDVEKFASESDVYLRYSDHIDLYSSYFGMQNIMVKAYEKEQLSPGLFPNFADSLGIDDVSSFTLNEKPRYNAQLSREALEFLNICNKLPLDQDKRNWLKLLIRRVMNQFDSNIVFRKQELLSSSQRFNLVAKYDDCNSKIAKDYLQRKDGRLFYEKPAEENDKSQSFPGISVEQAIDMIMRVFLNGIQTAPERKKRKKAIQDLLELAIEIAPLNYRYYDWKEDKIFRDHLEEI